MKSISTRKILGYVYGYAQESRRAKDVVSLAISSCWLDGTYIRTSLNDQMSSCQELCGHLVHVCI